jgi:hypothetical protein
MPCIKLLVVVRNDSSGSPLENVAVCALTYVSGRYAGTLGPKFASSARDKRVRAGGGHHAKTKRHGKAWAKHAAYADSL